MTDNEIIKAFEICRDQDRCDECAYAEDVDCLRRREKDAINLMKYQQARIRRLECVIRHMNESEGEG